MALRPGRRCGFGTRFADAVRLEALERRLDRALPRSRWPCGLCPPWRERVPREGGAGAGDAGCSPRRSPPLGSARPAFSSRTLGAMGGRVASAAAEWRGPASGRTPSAGKGGQLLRRRAKSSQASLGADTKLRVGPREHPLSPREQRKRGARESRLGTETAPSRYQETRRGGQDPWHTTVPGRGSFLMTGSVRVRSPPIAGNKGDHLPRPEVRAQENSQGKNSKPRTVFEEACRRFWEGREGGKRGGLPTCEVAIIGTSREAASNRPMGEHQVRSRQSALDGRAPRSLISDRSAKRGRTGPRLGRASERASERRVSATLSDAVPLRGRRGAFSCCFIRGV